MAPAIVVVHAVFSLMFSVMFFMSVPTPSIPVIGPLMDLRTPEEMERYAGTMWFCALIGAAAAFFNPGFLHLVYGAAHHALVQHSWGHLFLIFIWAVMFTAEVAYFMGTVLLVLLSL